MFTNWSSTLAQHVSFIIALGVLIILNIFWKLFSVWQSDKENQKGNTNVNDTSQGTTGQTSDDGRE